jgi:hypothetical protein
VDNARRIRCVGVNPVFRDWLRQPVLAGAIGTLVAVRSLGGDVWQQPGRGAAATGLLTAAAETVAEFGHPLPGWEADAGRETAGADPPPATGHATTGVGGGTFDLNGFLGADRYYDHATPITGQNTIAFNLEAGHFWNGHETLAHVATNTTNFVNAADTWGPTPAAAGTIPPLYDRHATQAAMLIGGRETQVDPELRQQGLAPGTSLRSAAIATTWSGNAYALFFGISGSTYITAYTGAFGTADVVNSSYGYADPSGTNTFTLFSDAMSFQNPGTLHVVSAGNSGPASNTVGAPGSGYNTLTVAALGGANTFSTVAGFSSRGPQAFGYYDELGQIVTVAGVRAAVDIAAPGESITSAFYGGQNGGNNATLAGSTDQGSTPDAYSDFINGTSFAAPLVAGGAALVASAAQTLPTLAGNPAASQSVVVKALLLNGADKTSGWTNGQQQVTVGASSFVETTQSLDWSVGTGRMNLATTFDLQVNGQTDVAGTGTGLLGPVVKAGWDYGSSVIGMDNDYAISEWLLGGTTFTASLAWMRARERDSGTGNLFEVAQADLDLSIWELDGGNNLTTLIARSASDYNTVEHLSFTLPRSGFYGLRVEYAANTFDNTTGGIWGSAILPQEYGLSWQAVPEPAGMALAAAATAAGLVPRLNRRGRQGGPTRPS